MAEAFKIYNAFLQGIGFKGKLTGNNHISHISWEKKMVSFLFPADFFLGPVL